MQHFYPWGAFMTFHTQPIILFLFLYNLCAQIDTKKQKPKTPYKPHSSSVSVLPPQLHSLSLLCSAILWNSLQWQTQLSTTSWTNNNNNKHPLPQNPEESQHSHTQPAIPLHAYSHAFTVLASFTLPKLSVATKTLTSVSEQLIAEATLLTVTACLASRPSHHSKFKFQTQLLHLLWTSFGSTLFRPITSNKSSFISTVLPQLHFLSLVFMEMQPQMNLSLQALMALTM